MTERNRNTNSTDYRLPEMWGRMTDQQKSDWFTLWRVRRLAMQQNTTVGRELRRQKERMEQNKNFKVDEELE